MMALYGAPVWSKKLSGIKRCRAKFNSFQPSELHEATEPFPSEAATLTARFPSLDILRDMDAEIYKRFHWRDESESLSQAEIRNENTDMH